MSAPFSTEQVLAGIQAFVHQEVDSTLTVDRDASVYTYHDAVADSHECPLWFLQELSAYFGLEESDRRWIVWLKLPRDRRRKRRSKRQQKADWKKWEQNVAPQLTVRKMAKWLARRAPGVSMAPVTVFGNRCRAAGIFRGLAKLPEVRGRRVGPSTPLLDIIPPTLCASFWRRAEWVSGARMAALRDIFRPSLLRSPAETLATVVMGAAIGAVVLCGYGAWHVAAEHAVLELLMAILGIFWLIVLLELPVRARDAVLDRFVSPLPEELQTFGDLARHIAQRQTAAD